jgi:hypothetical protein
MTGSVIAVRRSVGVARDAITGRVLVGSFLGLAWGASLRAWMALLAINLGGSPRFTWEGTFGAILLPAALMGALLGWAADAAAASHGTRWRWAVLSPLLLVVGPAIATPDFFRILFTFGFGGGAIAVALIGVVGGFAFSGFSARWIRAVCGLIVFLMTAAVGYLGASSGESGDAFRALLFVLLMGLLVAGVSAPARGAAH